ncbi:hypothetical protein HYH03_013564 [Edaphochlamys debaryana]|uniref:HYR domain-containing protein n=1 Tax=Edaphochlamys debaryana TaxID=47281 RepID=A0A835XMZ4_9CHLO|nr:hypothetical protein HYH03_013564 [Edaphochlamys debaryana]|eukprot:KAG2487847.1 hypothetical protein HYH03_013564 [Edaphochlamys debaryana]
MVTCTATDIAGNNVQTTFKVTVMDQTPPRFDLAAGSTITFETTASTPCCDDPVGSVTAAYTLPTAMDYIGTESSTGLVTVSCTPAPGTVFAFGSNAIVCSAKDALGNKVENVGFTLDVLDKTKPVLTTPADITAPAISTLGANVDFSLPTATDNNGAPSVSCTPAPKSFFTIADSPTMVTCTATDIAGNNVQTTFKVTVMDQTPPHFDLAAGSTITFETSTSTPCCITIVTYTATDAYGNSGTAVQTVTVNKDETPPVIGSVSDITRDATLPQGVVVTFTPPGASNAVDPGVTTTACQPPSGTTFPLGTTVVTCSASDKFGNSASKTFNVIVVFRSGCTWNGFFSPINNIDDNVVTTTQTLPLKWSLGGYYGVATLIDPAYPKLVTLSSCDTIIAKDTDVSGYTASSEGLTYDASTTQYQLNFKFSGKVTSKKCYRLELKFNDNACSIVRTLKIRVKWRG